MSVRAPVGPINFSNQHICIGRGLAAIRAKGEVDREFLFYSLLFKQPEITGNEGAVFASINKRQIENIHLLLPPIPEQKRIVAILDEAFAGIERAVANTEKNLANARELFESYQSKVFTEKGQGWITKPLGECFRLKSGDGLTKKAMVAGEFPVFGGNGIAGTHNAYNLAGDNVIIGRVGALCGNARHIIESIWLTDNAFKVIDKKYNIDNAFLTYLLNCKNLRKYARQSAQPVISNSSLKDILIDFPEAEAVQKKIVEKLNEIRSECGRLELGFEVCRPKNRENFLRETLRPYHFNGLALAALFRLVRFVVTRSNILALILWDIHAISHIHVSSIYKAKEQGRLGCRILPTGAQCAASQDGQIGGSNHS